MNKKDVYVVLSDTGSVLTRLIGFYTKSKYNHCSISFDPEFKTLYSFGRKQPKNPFIGGFVEESFYEGTFKRFSDTTCLVLKMRVDQESYDQIQRNINFFKENMDQYHYNFIGLFGATIGREISRGQSYYCSHFVAQVIEDANVNLWDKPIFLVTPEDFGNHEDFDIVYEGRMSEFKQSA